MPQNPNYVLVQSPLILTITEKFSSTALGHYLKTELG